MSCPPPFSGVLEGGQVCAKNIKAGLQCNERAKHDYLFSVDCILNDKVLF